MTGNLKEIQVIETQMKVGSKPKKQKDTTHI